MRMSGIPLPALLLLLALLPRPADADGTGGPAKLLVRPADLMGTGEAALAGEPASGTDEATLAAPALPPADDAPPAKPLLLFDPSAPSFTDEGGNGPGAGEATRIAAPSFRALETSPVETGAADRRATPPDPFARDGHRPKEPLNLSPAALTGD